VLLNESSYKYQILIIAAVLALGTAAVYWPVHGYGFVNYDDVTYVVSNPQVQAGLTLAGLKWASTTFYASNWHPLTWLSLMADVQLFGLNPGPHHIINVVLHILNAWLLFLVLTTMTEALWPSAIVAGLFAWHPLHVQSVAWIAERKDVLSTFFGLLALLAYTRYAKSNDRKWLVMAFFSFAFSLMAKPMLVTLPFVFLLTDFWPLKRTVSAGSETRPLIGEKLPFFLLSGVSSIVTFIAQRNGGEVIPVENRAADLLTLADRNLTGAAADHLNSSYLLQTLETLVAGGLVLVFRHARTSHRAGSGRESGDGRPLLLSADRRHLYSAGVEYGAIMGNDDRSRRRAGHSFNHHVHRSASVAGYADSV